MRVLITIAVAFLTFAVAVAMPAGAQVQPKLQVGAFGGWMEPVPPMKVPPTLRRFIPEGAILRAIINTQMTPEGETCLLYDNGENFPEVHLDIVRAAKVTSLFDSVVEGVAGLVPFTIDPTSPMLAFAYHEGGDCSDTKFAIFAARAGSYQKIFENQTEEGRIKIFEDSTEHIEVWSASYRMSMKECIWCPHQYRIKSFYWQRGQFMQTHTRRTSEHFDPSEIAAIPFVLLPVKQVSSNPSQP